MFWFPSLAEEVGARVLKTKTKVKGKSKGGYIHVECCHCGRKGHIKKFYWKLRKENDKASKDEQKEI